MTRTYRLALLIVPVALLAACAGAREMRANVAGNTYLACLHRAADQYMDNPAGAEQIAAAAHGHCWAEWNAYRDETQTQFAATAKTPEELQLARDKADAYLRQFETDARKAVMTRVVQRTYSLPQSR